MKRTTLSLAVAAAMIASMIPAGAQTAPFESANVEAQLSEKPRDAGGLEPSSANPISGEPMPQKMTTMRLGSGEEQRVYLIRFADDPVPTYRGGVEGLAPTAVEGGDRLDVEDAAARQYADHLIAEQAEFIDRMERAVGRDVEVPFTYQYAVNGMAAVLTPDEARQVAEDPSVIYIAEDEERELHTDAGPQWLGAEALWDAMESLGLPEDIKGEGVIIGTIDTGISPGNRSFAERGDDGHVHQNPLGDGVFLGVCDPSNPDYDPDFPCNNKLIGAWGFMGIGALDYNGHGSHVAGTSGGNVVNNIRVAAPTMTTERFDISGVAPHANVISYLGCCAVSALTASINQAIADGVDVINYSIGSTAPSQLWDDFDTVGYLAARAAGIIVVTSNGNSGPFFASTGSPSDAPWIIGVGASTHNRHNGNVLYGLTSTAGRHPDIHGKSVTDRLRRAPLVYAGDHGDPLCGSPTGNEEAFARAIVICDRGIFGRVEKSENVANQGAVGFILINDEINGDSLNGDAFAVPGVFITYDDGQSLLEWLAEGERHSGLIGRTEFVVDDEYGDIMASFSSRGPNRAVDVIVPSVTAPGVDILAALGAGNDTNDYGIDIHGFISGTSMSSPHVAGASALVRQARPDWTPAEVQSAFMTTARNTVRNHDGELATPYAQGSGHVNVTDAIRAGLLFDESIENYLGANPEEGGDARTLNVASFADTLCILVCEWTRTAHVPVNEHLPVPDNVTWTVSTTTDEGLSLDVALSDDTLSPGDEVTISVTADVTGAETGETLFGWIALTPSFRSIPVVTMPVAVVGETSVLPDDIDIVTRRDAGSQGVEGIISIPVTDFTGAMHGFVEAEYLEGSLFQDPTRDDPYDDLSQVDVYTFDLPEGTSRFVVESIEAEMADLDLFVGTGSTPSLATELCASLTPGSFEKCDFQSPAAGTYWVLVQSWAGSADQPDAYTLSLGIVPSDDLGNGGVDGPDDPVSSGDPYDVTVYWDFDEIEEGSRWYGNASLGSSPPTPGDVGAFGVNLTRIEDDVTKTASVEEADAGDTISYDITIQPNVGDSDLVYSITDTVPDGFTIDESSVTGDGVVDGQTISWVVEVPTAAGETGEYVATTSFEDPWCAAMSGFVDLGAVGIPFEPIFDGDTVAATAFSSIGPFEYFGESFPNLVVTEDGFVTVTGGYGGAPWAPQVIPDPAFPNGVIAPLWSDLELSLDNERGIRLAIAGGEAAVIQWEHPFEWGGDPTDMSNSVGIFQTWIYNSVSPDRPEITFDFGPMNALPSVATIGVEDILGEQATAILQAADAAGVVESGFSICLDYEAAQLDPITVSYDVTVDLDVEDGMYTNEAVHITDDPYAQEAVASVDVWVNAAAPAEADLAISKDGEVSDSGIAYTIEVTNHGPDGATGVQVSDELPEEVEYVSDSCEAEPGAPWVWDIGDLAAGDTVTCVIEVEVITAGVIENTATVTGDQDDPDPDNNTSTATVEVTDPDECTVTITGRNVGPLNVNEGVTCLEGATQTGPVSVSAGAGIRIIESRVTGPVTANGASEVTACDSRFVGPLTSNGASAVTIGDGGDCAGNQVTGPVTVNNTDGPSVIAGNRIIGPLSCTGNDPAPVNNGATNQVIGPKSGQCSGL